MRKWLTVIWWPSMQWLESFLERFLNRMVTCLLYHVKWKKENIKANTVWLVHRKKEDGNIHMLIEAPYE